jgi:hypothetical protein
MLSGTIDENEVLHKFTNGRLLNSNEQMPSPVESVQLCPGYGCSCELRIAIELKGVIGRMKDERWGINPGYPVDRGETGFM